MTTPAVLSVEKFSIAMPNGTVSTPALSLGQNINNCVPFMTLECDDATNGAQMVDVAKNTGTNKFDFVAAADGTRNLEVTVVEFDPDEVTIQEVAFTLGSGLSVDVAVTAIVEAATFAIVYSSSAADFSSVFENMMTRVTFTSTTNLRIIKDTHSQDHTGHAYILEATAGAWAVETGATIPIPYTSGNKTKNSAITVVKARTGVWASWDTDENSDDARDAVWNATITDNTNLDLTRAYTGSPFVSGDIEVFVVEFAVEVAAVQHGEFDYLTAASKTAAISAPSELDNTMIVGTNYSSWVEGSDQVGAVKIASQGAMTFNSATEVLGTRSGVGAGNNRQNFQVIEWLIAAVGGAAAQPIIIHIG